jgi:hypothetical protein
MTIRDTGPRAARAPLWRRAAGRRPARPLHRDRGTDVEKRATRVVPAGDHRETHADAGARRPAHRRRPLEARRVRRHAQLGRSRRGRQSDPGRTRPFPVGERRMPLPPSTTRAGQAPHGCFARGRVEGDACASPLRQQPCPSTREVSGNRRFQLQDHAKRAEGSVKVWAG